MSKLRAAHAADEDTTRSGIDVLSGGVGDMAELGIFEAFKVCTVVQCIQFHNCVRITVRMCGIASSVSLLST